MKKLILLFAILVSGVASAQEGGFSWTNETEGSARLNGVEYTQLGTFFTDYADIMEVTRNINGATVVFEREDGAWRHVRWNDISTNRECFGRHYIYIDSNGHYRTSTPFTTDVSPFTNIVGRGTYEEFLEVLFAAMDLRAEQQCS